MSERPAVSNVYYLAAASPEPPPVPHLSPWQRARLPLLAGWWRARLLVTEVRFAARRAWQAGDDDSAFLLGRAEIERPAARRSRGPARVIELDAARRRRSSPAV
jgi:hypothetical protein